MALALADFGRSGPLAAPYLETKVSQIFETRFDNDFQKLFSFIYFLSILKILISTVKNAFPELTLDTFLTYNFIVVAEMVL